MKEAFGNVFEAFRLHLCLLSGNETENSESEVKHDLSRENGNGVLEDLKPEVSAIDFMPRNYSAKFLEESFEEDNYEPTCQNRRGKRERIKYRGSLQKIDDEKVKVRKDALPEVEEGENEGVAVESVSIGDEEVERRKSRRHRPSRKLLESQQFGDEEENAVGNALERGSICNECGLSFTCRKSLLVHDRIHKGVKPYQCRCESEIL